MKKIHIAIVGATGLVGQTFLKVLEEYDFQIASIKLFASPNSLGKSLQFKGQSYNIETVQPGCFRGIDYVLMSAGKKVSTDVAPQAVKEGAIVIDNSSAFRMHEEVPLVVPEVNLNDANQKRLIANPNCSTIQSVLPLKALQDAFGLESIDYHTYQAVSGSGIKGLNDLHRKESVPQFYPYDIQKTVIPHIDSFLSSGYTYEEQKMIDETKKILHDPQLRITATCVRVPVEFGHAVSMKVKLKQEASLETIQHTLKSFKSIIVVDDPSQLKYPVSTLAVGNDFVYVGRIRKDLHDPFSVLMFVVADNIRKGAASNAIQIMKGLMHHDDTH
jgi:aspartate-semialdehyde dehydrogenase